MAPGQHQGPKAVGPLMRALLGDEGSLVIAHSASCPSCLVRPGELPHAEWSEFDEEAAEWRIPAAKMKTLHIVPLSQQALDVLRSLHPLTGGGRHVFPSERSAERPMGEKP